MIHVDTSALFVRAVSLAVVLLLFGGISSLVLYSISPLEAYSQAVFAVLGIFVFALSARVPRILYMNGYRVIYGVMIALLLATLLLGYQAKGARRWISLGSIRVQTSEIAKPLLLVSCSIFAAQYTLRRQREITRYLFFALVPVALVFVQPDLGTSLVLLVIVFSVLFFRIGSLTRLIPWGVLFVLFSLIAWQFVLHPYQKDRLFSFFGFGSESGTAYNARQAIITLGSGKLTGRGLGHGVQTQLRFLPEHHTDFFFASFGEEFGLLGIFFILLLYICLYFILLWRIFSYHPIDQTVRLAVAASLFFQMYVHMGMNSGLLPVTGIPLPFLSSGGSSFLSSSILLGIAMSFSSPKVPTHTRTPFTKPPFPDIL